MYKNNRILGLIPARGASKGLRHKNIRLLNGKPLIAWTIKEAKKSKYIDRIIVSTENRRIAQIAQKYGVEVPFLRPVNLASDKSGTLEVVLHAISFLEKEKMGEWGYVLLLQPTSPLRSHVDIDRAIKAFFSQKKADALVSIIPVNENPFWMQTVNKKGFIQPLIKQKTMVTRRQDLPQAYLINGAIYICSTEVLKNKRTLIPENTGYFIMPRERSIDIDDQYDLAVAEMLIKK